ncbi:hypothetical protein ACIQ34_11460 [Ureibacillus sp. NPDC094379]
MYNFQDLIRFKKELYFNGAVQVDWFYNKEKQYDVASSFVFHGPEYFGVSKNEIAFKTHKLHDTATFMNVLVDKLYGDSPLSNFFMTIAPYGTGKSHLSVTLASFLSGNEKVQNVVLKNLSSVDSKIAKQVNQYELKPNLVLILNGMRDFNLNYEILNATQKILQVHNIDSDFLKDLTKSYDIAKVFVENTFENYQDLYETFCKDLSNTSANSDLKNYLVENILADTDVFEIINKVYKEINGTYIRWDEGVSAGDVLEKIADKLCGEREPFNKVVLFFDEFGRYIEFASNNPTKASDAALQQIYEAVQNADDKIIFIGFIQSDLKSYLTRVDRTANINRYVGRYESSEKIHLSSNLETIFANLVERKDPKAFKELVIEKIEKNESKWKVFHSKFISWSPDAVNSSVWSDYTHFRKVILEGIYPLHPLTSWILSNLSSWLQQRSSLTFLETQINTLKDLPVNEFGDLLLVPSTRIIRTEFFNELLAAEQEGRKQSEYCILYNQILTKYGDKLDERAKEVLAGILISRIGRFKTHSRNETVELISYASDISVKEINLAVDQLENQFGVLSYDEVANVFDFIADAIGVSDFKLLVKKKKRNIEINMSYIFDMGLADELQLEDIEPAFSTRHAVKTHEWKFTQHLMNIEDITPRKLAEIKMKHIEAVEPEKPKGQIIWLYVPSEYDTAKFSNIQQLLRAENFGNLPVAFFILDDKENKFYDAIVDLQVSKSFTEAELEKYRRFVIDFEEKTRAVLTDSYRELAVQRLHLTSSNIEKVNRRLNSFTDELFEKLYTKIIPFAFSEFALKRLSNGKKMLSRIGRIITSNIIYQMVHSESPEIKGRVESLLYQNVSVESWGVLNTDYKLVAPRNPKIQSIFNEWDLILEQIGEMEVQELFDKYQKVPYGINDYALTLLIGIYLASRREETKIQLDSKRVRLEDWAQNIFTDKNINLKSLFATKIVKVKPDESANKILGLYKKVVQNADVEVAKQLYEQFLDLKEEEDIPAELEDKVANIEIILREGNKLQNDTVRLFGSLKSKLSEAKSKDNDVRGFFDVLDETAKIQGPISSSDRYVYNEEQLNLARSLENSAHQYFGKVFPIFLKNLKCQSKGQATFFEKWVKRIVESMNLYEYKDEAKALITKMEQILDSLDPVQDQVNEFISKSNPKSILGYSKLIQIESNGEKLIPLINKSKLREKDKDSNILQVQKILDDTKDALKVLNDEVMEIYDAIYGIETFSDCQSFILKVKNILSKDIKENDREGIEEAANHVQNFINDLDSIKSKQDNRFEVNQEFQFLKDKWVDIESEVDFMNIIENYQQEIDMRLNQKEVDWLKRFEFTEQDLTKWTAEQCTAWLGKVNNVPNYLTDKNLQNLSDLKVKVQTRMKDLSIEAVISLFNNLTSEEKIEAIEKMKVLI